MRVFITILLFIAFSCNEQGPSPANKFINSWHCDSFCNSRELDIIITQGSKPDELIISGQISVTVTGNTFQGTMSGITHKGEILSSGELSYCQEGFNIQCCGTFTQKNRN